MSQRLENWGALATGRTWEQYEIARHDIVIYLDSQVSPRSFMRNKVIPKLPGSRLGEISAITCRTATKLGEPKQRSPPASSIKSFIMILLYTWIPSPARARSGAKKVIPGSLFHQFALVPIHTFPKTTLPEWSTQKTLRARERGDTELYNGTSLIRKLQRSSEKSVFENHNSNLCYPFMLCFWTKITTN